MSIVLSEWGLAGVEALLGQAAVLIIVDVLSFSTAVDVAVARGAKVFPFRYGDRQAAEQEAVRVGAELARPRQTAGGKLSLSPRSLAAIEPGTSLLLPSPNGSRLSLSCGERPVLTACLRNAAAVAAAARDIAGDGVVGVIPAGERWSTAAFVQRLRTCWARAPSSIT
jgi:2-phosphosulfolactate phosphatase